MWELPIRKPASVAVSVKSKGYPLKLGQTTTEEVSEPPSQELGYILNSGF
jgi:hypothetical protein